MDRRHEAAGAMLTGLTGMTLGGSVLIARLNHYANGGLDS